MNALSSRTCIELYRIKYILYLKRINIKHRVKTLRKIKLFLCKKIIKKNCLKLILVDSAIQRRLKRSVDKTEENGYYKFSRHKFGRKSLEKPWWHVANHK